MKTMNDINAVYDQGLKTLPNGQHVCPMCQKMYSNELAGRKHVNSRSCHKMLDVIKDTVHETKAYGVYKILITATKPNARISLQTFRKSPLYNPVARFSMFCSLHSVFSPDVYISWLNEIKGYATVNSVLAAGVDENNLREWRVFVHKFNMIPSEYFYNSYKEDLLTDDEFFTRSIEKAQLGLIFLAEQDDFPFEERMERLPADYKQRVLAILAEVAQ